MADITQINSDRINNIRAFTQGVNINAIRNDSTKNLLALEDACRELASTEQERRSAKEGAPRLTAPKMTLAQAKAEASTYQQPAEEAGASAAAGAAGMLGSEASSKASGFNATASLIGSIATLRQILSSGNLAELRGRLQVINAESSALRAQGEVLLSALENGVNELQIATDKVEKGNQAWQQSKETVTELKQQQQGMKTQLVSAEDKLSKTQQKLAQARSELKALPTPPQTPAQQAQFESLTAEITLLSSGQRTLQTTVTQVSNSLTALNGKLSLAESDTAQLQDTYEQALQQSTVVGLKTDNNRKEINNFIENASRPPEVDGERWESSLALLTLLTAQLKKALNDDSIKNMRQQQEVMATINEATRKDSEKKAKEAEEAQAKAEEGNKAASCASKIFGYIMLAVSVVATIASFGTAGPLMLAVAAIGIAMTVADIVLEETGQSGLMQMLSAEISKGITNMLIACGVPAEKAKDIGGIIGMVLAAIVFLAISLFSMSSFAKNIGQTVANVTKNVGKQVAGLMKSAVKALPRDFINAAGKMGSKVANLSKPLTNMAGKAGNMVKVSDVTARKIEIGLNSTNMVLGVTNAAVSGGLSLHANSFIRDMKEMLAGMMLNTAFIQALDELLKALIKSMSKSHEQLNEMFEGMMTALNESGAAKANMMKSSSFV
ncbi:putative type III secretion system effector protein [Yersinia aldovae]|uniref:type III secretion system translocon subunit SctE n=1 Tax=Yersinia aldovae TaxID=29483 RepID=UPI0005E92D8A|nr:type III secretion system translocon subunit SctE [Yersinia aldovae]CNK23069.1 putative type III secretion system effector protein [Yersinia aldovae]